MAGLLLAAYGYTEATRSPRVVEYAVRTPLWTALPVRIALLSDTHMIGPEMPPARLARIVAQVNALKPDIILLAGDYRGDRAFGTRYYSGLQVVAPFARLRAPLGVYAVLGNHDHGGPGIANATTAGLGASRVTLLNNRAVRTAAGFWIAGANDPASGDAHPERALAQVPRGAPALLLVHNPDLFADAPPSAALTLAGHTHGGQIAPPGIGPIFVPVSHREWTRGLFRARGRTLIVTSGVGASGLPLRIGVPPEVVLVTLSGVTSALPAAREGKNAETE